jgi:hypothetical protein
MTAHTLIPIAILSILGFVLIGGALSHRRASRTQNTGDDGFTSTGLFGDTSGHHGDCGGHSGDCGGGGGGH